jgi:excisionase family DNA binding protein
MTDSITLTIPDELLTRLAEYLGPHLLTVEAEPRPSYVTVREAAEHMGCSIDHVRQLYRAKEIRAYRPGKQILIETASLDEYIRSRPV